MTELTERWKRATLFLGSSSDNTQNSNSQNSIASNTTLSQLPTHPLNVLNQDELIQTPLHQKSSYDSTSTKEAPHPVLFQTPARLSAQTTPMNRNSFSQLNPLRVSLSSTPHIGSFRPSSDFSISGSLTSEFGSLNSKTGYTPHSSLKFNSARLSDAQWRWTPLEEPNHQQEERFSESDFRQNSSSAMQAKTLSTYCIQDEQEHRRLDEDVSAGCKLQKAESNGDLLRLLL